MRRDTDLSVAPKGRISLRRRKRSKPAWIVSKPDCEPTWPRRLENNTSEPPISLSLTLSFPSSEPPRLPHKTHNMQSQSHIIFSRELWWFDWRASLQMVCRTGQSSRGGSGGLKLGQHCVVDKKPAATVDLNLSWNNRNLIPCPRIRRMTRKIGFPWCASILNASSALIMTASHIWSESLSTPPLTKWWMRRRSTWGHSHPRIRSRVRIHNVRKQHWSYRRWWHSRRTPPMCIRYSFETQLGVKPS